MIRSRIPLGPPDPALPLVSVLLFMQAAFDQHPEDIVADFLQQVHDTA